MGNDGHENEIAEDIVAVSVDLAGCGGIEGSYGEGETTNELLVTEGYDENFKEGTRRLKAQTVANYLNSAAGEEGKTGCEHEGQIGLAKKIISLPYFRDCKTLCGISKSALRLLLTPTPVMEGSLANSPYFTEPIVQFTSGSQSYFRLHSRTLVAVPMLWLFRGVSERKKENSIHSIYLE